MPYLSLGEQLAFMLYDQETRAALAYRHRQRHNTGIYGDMLDDDLFQNEHHVALTLYIDGFQPFDGSNRAMTIVDAVILNFPPSMT